MKANLIFASSLVLEFFCRTQERTRVEKGEKRRRRRLKFDFEISKSVCPCLNGFSSDGWLERLKLRPSTLPSTQASKHPSISSQASCKHLKYHEQSTIKVYYLIGNLKHYVSSYRYSTFQCYYYTTLH
jgi:hypothetical protein